MNPPELFPEAGENREGGISEEAQTFSRAGEGTGAGGTYVLCGWELHTPQSGFVEVN